VTTLVTRYGNTTRRPAPQPGPAPQAPGSMLSGRQMLCGSSRSRLAYFVNQTAGHATLRRRACNGLSREFAQLFGVDPQLFNDVDPRASLVVVVALMSQHDGMILLDRRPGVFSIQLAISDHASVLNVLQEKPPSRRDKNLRLSDRSGTVAVVFYVLGLTVKLLLPILEDRA
jgi:hypothetical protein